MRFDLESWRKLYRHEPLEQRAWSLLQRGIRDYLIRFPEELDGALMRIDPDVDDPVGQAAEALTNVLAPHPHEREDTIAALVGLLRDRYVDINRDTGLVRIRNYERAQRSSAALRKAKQRGKGKSPRETAGAIPAPDTGGHPPGQQVGHECDSQRDNGSPPLTLSPPTLPDPTRPDEKARGRARGDGGGGASEDRADRETICPLDLGERVEAAKIPAEFADRFGVPIEIIRKAIDEFITYWTIGGGTGKRRRNWPARLRQRLVELHQQGLLAVAPDSNAAHDAEIARKNREMRERDERETARVRAELLGEAGDTDPEKARQRVLAALGRPGGDPA